MARKKSLDESQDNYTMLIDIILSLSPKQAHDLYVELKPRYTRSGRINLYNDDGVEDKENGLVRLTEYQYKAILTKYGKRYFTQAIHTLHRWLASKKEHPEINKQLLRKYGKGSHYKYFIPPDGWVWLANRRFAVSAEEEIIVNPLVIDDISVARRYIESLSPSMRKMPDVMFLIEKFPQLKDLIEDNR